jgi:hypothetical protein
MSNNPQHPAKRILLHSDAQGTIRLHVEEDGTTHQFEDLLQAITAARQRGTDGATLLIAYDALGAVVFEQYI